MKSKLSRVGTTLKYIQAKDFEIEKKMRKRQSASTSNSQDDILAEVIKKGLEVESKAELLSFFSNENRISCQDLELHSLMYLYEDLCHCCPDEFLLFCSVKMKPDDCIKANKLTFGQSSTNAWFRLRYGRITASKFYEASHCKVDGSLVQVKLFSRFLFFYVLH